MSHQVTIFFAYGSASWGMILRSWRRPGVAWRATLSRLGKIVTRSKYSHVSVCVGVEVLDKQMSGARVWPLSTYIRKYPTLSHAYIVRTPLPASLHHIHNMGPIKPLHSIHKWLTNGRRQTDDCVCITRRVLRDAGVDVPRWACHPGKLDKWLSEQHYKRVDL